MNWSELSKIASIGPSVDKNVALKACEELMELEPNQRACVFDRLLCYLRQHDKQLASALESHKSHLIWNQSVVHETKHKYSRGLK